MRVAIPLTNGGVTWVSPEDADLASRHSWHRTQHGYAQCNHEVGGIRPMLHRFLLNPPAELVVDHLNAIRLDNQRHNLEAITAAENNRRAAERRLWLRLWAASADQRGQLNLFPVEPGNTDRRTGEANRYAKLKRWQAAVIKFGSAPVAVYAQEFAVSYSTAQLIRAGKAWKHITLDDLPVKAEAPEPLAIAA